MLAEKFTFIPCHDEKRCGYKRKDHGWPPSEDISEFFGLAVVMNDEGEGETMLLNPGRFDLEKAPKGGEKAFCDWGGERWCPASRETPATANP